jgi:putative endonuclease
MYFVYILKCKDGSLYTGITNDIEKRMEVHRSGKGSKYVRARSPFELVYKEEHEDKSSALKREIQIKKMERYNKLELINTQ